MSNMKNTFQSIPQDRFPDSYGLVVGSPEQRHRSANIARCGRKTRNRAGAFVFKHRDKRVRAAPTDNLQKVLRHNVYLLKE